MGNKQLIWETQTCGGRAARLVGRASDAVADRKPAWRKSLPSSSMFGLVAKGVRWRDIVTSESERVRVP
jgi:hypothetical protein